MTLTIPQRAKDMEIVGGEEARSEEVGAQRRETCKSESSRQKYPKKTECENGSARKKNSRSMPPMRNEKAPTTDVSEDQSGTGGLMLFSPRNWRTFDQQLRPAQWLVHSSSQLAANCSLGTMKLSATRLTCKQCGTKFQGMFISDCIVKSPNEFDCSHHALRYDYRTADAMVRDFELMKSNAIKFNGQANPISQEAVSIHDFVRDQVESKRAELSALEEAVSEQMSTKPKKKRKTGTTKKSANAASGTVASVGGVSVNLGDVSHFDGIDSDSDSDSD
jgi:hypothetical protein